MARSSPEFFNLNSLDLGVLKSLRAKLISSGYDEQRIRKKLRIEHSDYLFIDPLCVPLFRHLAKGKTSLDIMISLFILETPRRMAELSTIFSRDEIRQLSRMNLIRVDLKRGLIFPKVVIYPYKGFFIMTDMAGAPDLAGCDERSVYRVGMDSFYLAEASSGLKGRSCLDICCGSGIQSLAASRNCESVMGIDINPRAVNFARFNAIFNQVDNVTFICGDLYGPAKGMRFDVILANVPFVAMPGQIRRKLYGDGGKAGDENTQKVIRGMGSHLKTGGIGLMITEISEIEGISSKKMMRVLVNDLKLKVLQVPAALGCSCPRCYSVSHCIPLLTTKNFEQYEQCVVRWYDNLCRNRIVKRDLALLCIKKSKSFKLIEAKYDGSDQDISEKIKLFSYL
ncbi:MAG: methyltransferase domain-containing protein [archaeon]